jgi:hypothetical protein
MMKTMDFADARVVAVRASGHISTEDYEQVLIPAIETALARFSRVRIPYVVEDFEGFAPLALWDDAKRRSQSSRMHDQRIRVIEPRGRLRPRVSFLSERFRLAVSARPIRDAQGWLSCAMAITESQRSNGA